MSQFEVTPSKTSSYPGVSGPVRTLPQIEGTQFDPKCSHLLEFLNWTEPSVGEAFLKCAFRKTRKITPAKLLSALEHDSVPKEIRPLVEPKYADQLQQLFDAATRIVRSINKEGSAGEQVSMTPGLGRVLTVQALFTCRGDVKAAFALRNIEEVTFKAEIKWLTLYTGLPKEIISYFIRQQLKTELLQGSIEGILPAWDQKRWFTKMKSLPSVSNLPASASPVGAAAQATVPVPPATPLLSNVAYTPQEAFIIKSCVDAVKLLQALATQDVAVTSRIDIDAAYTSAFLVSAVESRGNFDRVAVVLRIGSDRDKYLSRLMLQTRGHFKKVAQLAAAIRTTVAKGAKLFPDVVDVNLFCCADWIKLIENEKRRRSGAVIAPVPNFLSPPVVDPLEKVRQMISPASQQRTTEGQAAFLTARSADSLERAQYYRDEPTSFVRAFAEGRDRVCLSYFLGSIAWFLLVQEKGDIHAASRRLLNDVHGNVRNQATLFEQFAKDSILSLQTIPLAPHLEVSRKYISPAEVVDATSYVKAFINLITSELKDPPNDGEVEQLADFLDIFPRDVARIMGVNYQTVSGELLLLSPPVLRPPPTPKVLSHNIEEELGLKWE